jgi:hypothetical protein
MYRGIYRLFYISLVATRTNSLFTSCCRSKVGRPELFLRCGTISALNYCHLPHTAARTATHCRTITHCRTTALPYSATHCCAHCCTAAHCRTAAHGRTAAHCSTVAHCRAYCHQTLEYNYAYTSGFNMCKKLSLLDIHLTTLHLHLITGKFT